MINIQNHARPQVAQMALLFHPSKGLLLLQLACEKYQFPGGRLNKGEGFEQGLRREIKEETGIDCMKIICPLTVNQWQNNEGSVYGVHFLCETQIENISLSSDHIGFKWVRSQSELEKLSFIGSNMLKVAQTALELQVKSNPILNESVSLLTAENSRLLS